MTIPKQYTSFVPVIFNHICVSNNSLGRFHRYSEQLDIDISRKFADIVKGIPAKASCYNYFATLFIQLITFKRIKAFSVLAFSLFFFIFNPLTVFYIELLLQYIIGNQAILFLMKSVLA